MLLPHTKIRPFAASPLPRHIAIIMDGNGRWAALRGKPRAFGHRAGAEAVQRTAAACAEWGIPVLTLYAFSTENWRRPESEVRALLALLRRYLQKGIADLRRRGVRLRFIGDLQRFPAALRQRMMEAAAALAGNRGLQVILALNYGGRDEIVRACRALARLAATGALAPEDIGEETFASHLDTAGIPDPDLVIRTAGEMRLSNFLLWQTAYAEYYSSPVCWPDFDREELAAAIRAFQARTRKFGGIAAPPEPPPAKR
ncbi:MAG: isoprenyl transferase [Planctomycetota bacterium]|nr:isoprenyl transferase [Planctomycetota bacterium]